MLCRDRFRMHLMLHVSWGEGLLGLLHQAHFSSPAKIPSVSPARTPAHKQRQISAKIFVS